LATDLALSFLTLAVPITGFGIMGRIHVYSGLHLIASVQTYFAKDFGLFWTSSFFKIINL